MSVGPGQTQLTRMPSGPWSIAMARVSEMTAPLEAQYAAAFAAATRPSCEAMFTIAPPPAARRCGIAARPVR